MTCFRRQDPPYIKCSIVKKSNCMHRKVLRGCAGSVLPFVLALMSTHTLWHFELGLYVDWGYFYPLDTSEKILRVTCFAMSLLIRGACKQCCDSAQSVRLLNRADLQQQSCFHGLISMSHASCSGMFQD